MPENIAENATRKTPEETNAPTDRRVSQHLHSAVYATVVGLMFLYIASMWMFFDIDAYMGLILAVVIGLFVAAFAIPYLIWRTRRKHGEADDEQNAPASLRDWAASEFQTWQDQRKATSAAFEITLPIAAVAFGLLLIGLIFHMVGTNVTAM